MTCNVRTLLVPLFTFACLLSARADDRSIAEALRTAGATKIEQDKDGVVTTLFFQDSSKITPEQWKLIGQLSGVKQVTFYHQCTLNDETLPLILGLATLESFTSDGAQLSDAAMAKMVAWKNLKKLTFFHTSNDKGMTFTGSGFAALAELPQLESFSMGGAKFNDEGLAAVAKLAHLKDLRVWHTRNTPAGNVQLESLHDLISIYYSPDALTAADAPAHLAKLPNLEKITLMETRLTAAQLQPLAGLGHLKQLTLEKVEISPSDLAAVKAAMPKVEVKWTEPDEKALSGIRRAFDAKK